MKSIMVMFDSLNRHMLSAYGCDWVHTPNFQRLAERTATFDTCYVGSMPCMPARRELHTGRYNFLHRSWGPIEPFDDSMPEILKNAGVHTHLVSDHYHYWEEGGCNYHTRYSTWDAHRGQEGDPWLADLTDRVVIPDSRNNELRDAKWLRNDWTNRHYMPRQEDYPQAKTMAAGLEFIRTNASADNWFCHIETFDPHEPYFVPQKFIDMYPHEYAGKHWDWPKYGRAEMTEQEARHLRCLNAALVTMCDEYLGKVLDLMDELDLWKDTLLIVNTDHGFLLGEHDWWAKCSMPFYEEIAHTPLFVWDPRSRVAGERRTSLVQTIDLPATLLEYFGADRPADMQGVPLAATVADDTPVRQAGLFGLFGAQVNVTDGRYVYMRAPATPENAPLLEYTQMPTNMRRTFPVEQMRQAALAGPFAFTKGCPVMKIPGRPWVRAHEFGNLLFDLENDPKQEKPLTAPRGSGGLPSIEKRMIDLLIEQMQTNDAPPEQYQRLGLKR